MTNHFIGIGKYIPTETISNQFFEEHQFYNEQGEILDQNNATISHKLKQITGIEERRYARKDQVTSDLGYMAAADMVPSLAARVKNLLKIQNPYCVAYDVIFGCPGWVEGVIQANAFMKAGLAKRCLVIGAETLSRVVDEHDRDTMIYADGAGAVILEASENNKGIQAHLSASYANEEKDYLFFGKSYNSEKCPNTKYIKMYGRKIYEFALSKVPLAMKKCVDDSTYNIDDISKIVIHQANEKMDEAIVKRFYSLYDLDVPKNIMPMNIHKLGNSSVATIPILLKMIMDNDLINTI